MKPDIEVFVDSGPFLHSSTSVPHQRLPGPQILLLVQSKLRTSIRSFNALHHTLASTAFYTV